MLAHAEGYGPVDSRRDRRVYAGFTAAVSVAMGLGTVLMMLSPWMVIPYVVVILGLVWWQMGARQASPRGANRAYLWGILGAGVMILPVVFGLNVVRTELGLTAWWYLLGVLFVALPGLVAAAIIDRRGSER